MDAELAALAASGATALVQAMVGDGWAAARGRVAALLGRRGGAGEDAVGRELDAARAEFTAAQDAGDGAAADDVRAEWRARMRRALRADPEAAAELRALLDELGYGDDGRGGTVRNTISGGVQHGGVIQAHTVGDVHLG
ncbi:hypothetical protein GCM10018785_40860 [Streptomyces longispororuber]|uniref:CchlP n=1 Tax=Streptomyces longispororuber TaxID=68230 RepID=A0A918ZSF9_9ACTN|nr:hypothetical protein [Streptomyces longispororuber]GHE68074.1 hypothetical protein GCM10018785_40860 [Streptomyces longispororuber]